MAFGADNLSTNLLPGEQFILDRLASRECIDLAANHSAATATANRIITGKFLERLLAKDTAALSHDGLHLANAVIDGLVDLSNVEVPVPVWFDCCQFKNTVNLHAAHFDHDLSFQGCLFDGPFQADALQLGGTLELKPFQLRSLRWKTDFTAPPDQVSFDRYLSTNAIVQSWAPGQTEFKSVADRLTRRWRIRDVRNDPATHSWTNIFEVTACGESLFLVQKNDDVPPGIINSVINLTAGPFTNQWKVIPETGALDLDSLRAALATNLVVSPDYIREQVLTTNATAAIDSITWLLDDKNNPASLPLVAEWFGRSSVMFYQPTVFRSSVGLNGANIGGKLDAYAVEFLSLGCHSLKIGEDLVLSYAQFNDEAGFIYADIGHDFAFLNSSVKHGFNATGMHVGGSVILDNTRFCGGTDFDVVSVSGDFKAPYVRFENRTKLTEFRGLKVDGLVDFQRAQFAGPANFILSHIKGNFNASGATFEDRHSFAELQDITRDTFTFNVDFGSMQVDGFAIFENVLFTRSVSFRNARFANLYLDGTHWPDDSILATYRNVDPKPNELLRLEGMDFETIRDIASGHFLHTHDQLKESQTNLLAMFANRSPYSFDIYTKLENYFVREGAPDLADSVYVKGKKREGTEETTAQLSKFTNWFLYVTVGYGRSPWKAFVESLVIILLWAAMCKNLMKRKTAPHKGHHPGWGLALFYSLGTFLPIIELGTSDLLEHEASHDWFRYLVALEQILGFILVPLWTMALTGLIK